MSKRGLSFDSDSPSSARPSKRRQLFTPNPPFPCSSSSPVRSSAASNSSRNTTPYSVPTDSPTNPFGRRRVQNLELPRSTSFAKHLPLRIQLVHADSSDEACEGGGTFRIVQVPLNYSFKHLHRLLLWLFGGHPIGAGRTTARTGKGKERGVELPEAALAGHVFEIEKNVVMHSDMVRPGEMRQSTTWAKISSVRDPHVRQMREASLEAALDEEDASEWHWEGEDEFTVSQAWPDGGDLSRGIIYHHTPTISIHITVNTSKIPSRKGVSNEPFVFRARGVFSLPSLGPTPKPLFATKSAPLLHPSGLFPSHKPRVEPASTSEDPKGLDPEINIEESQFNAPDAFGKFLRKTPIPLPEDNDSSDDEEPYFRSSSPTFPSSDGLPFPPPMITPFPTRRSHIQRVAHASRRLAKLVRKGIRELDDEKAWHEILQDDEVPASALEGEEEGELTKVVDDALGDNDEIDELVEELRNKEDECSDGEDEEEDDYSRWRRREELDRDDGYDGEEEV